MVEVYYYIPANEAQNAVDCGLKLSRWYDKEVLVEGERKKCISTLLNPKDDIERFKSLEYKCLKLELNPDYCFVADRYLYDMGLESPEIMELYMKSVTPVKDYIFGSYRLPECLVMTTIIGGSIRELDKRRDIPVLFDNSEDLYINNIIENYKEYHNDFNDVMLYYFYSRLAEIEKVDKIEDNEKKIAVFIDRNRKKAHTIKIPEITSYC